MGLVRLTRLAVTRAGEGGLSALCSNQFAGGFGNPARVPEEFAGGLGNPARGPEELDGSTYAGTLHERCQCAPWTYPPRSRVCVVSRRSQARPDRSRSLPSAVKIDALVADQLSPDRDHERDVVLGLAAERARSRRAGDPSWSIAHRVRALRDAQIADEQVGLTSAGRHQFRHLGRRPPAARAALIHEHHSIIGLLHRTRVWGT